MTVETSTSRISHNGDGASTVFTVSFYFLANSHLTVTILDSDSVETVQVLDTDYTVTGAGDEAGGQVTFITAPASTDTITITRDVPATQEVEYPELDPFPAASHEQALDKLTMLVQQGSELNSRALHFPVSDDSNSELPSVANRASKYFVYDVNGLPSYSTGTGTDAGLRGDLASTDYALGSSLITHKVSNTSDSIGVALNTWMMMFVNIMSFVTPAALAANSDITTQIRSATTFCAGKPLYFPGSQYNYRVDSQIDLLSTTTTTFGQGVQIIGDGTGKTIFDNRVANGVMFNIGSDTSGEFLLGCTIRGIKILTTTSPANSDGIKLKTAYNVQLEQVHINGLTGSGVHIQTVVGDLDGSNMVNLHHVRIENCAKWGIDSAGDPGFNEFSFMTMDQVFIQGNGTNEYKAITGISKANPGVVTCTAHGFTNGQKIKIFGVRGMTQVNENTYTVTVVNANSFSIGVDTSGYGTYSSTGGGGECAPQTPGSGGMSWKGQILTLRQAAFTINENVALWIPGQSGLAQSVVVENCTMENNKKRGFYSTGISNITGNIFQIYNNNTYQAYVGFEADGASYTVRGITIQNPIIRATVRNGTTTDGTTAGGNGGYTAFKLSGANTNFDSCRIKSSVAVWDNFDYPGQTRFNGVQFDPVPMQCTTTVSDTATIVLRPDTVLGRGNKIPLFLRGGGGDNITTGGTPSTTGELTAHELSSGGISITNAGLANSTVYYVYVYDNSGNAALHLSTTAPTISTTTGLSVKTGATSYYYLVAVKTDGSANFLTSATGYLNPTIISGTQTGVNAYGWLAASGKLYIKTSIPTTDTDGTPQT